MQEQTGVPVSMSTWIPPAASKTVATNHHDNQARTGYSSIFHPAASSIGLHITEKAHGIIFTCFPAGFTWCPFFFMHRGDTQTYSWI